MSNLNALNYYREGLEKRLPFTVVFDFYCREDGPQMYVMTREGEEKAFGMICVTQYPNMSADIEFLSNKFATEETCAAVTKAMTDTHKEMTDASVPK